MPFAAIAKSSPISLGAALVFFLCVLTYYSTGFRVQLSTYANSATHEAQLEGGPRSSRADETASGATAEKTENPGFSDRLATQLASLLEENRLLRAANVSQAILLRGDQKSLASLLKENRLLRAANASQAILQASLLAENNRLRVRGSHPHGPSGIWNESRPAVRSKTTAPVTTSTSSVTQSGATPSTQRPLPTGFPLCSRTTKSVIFRDLSVQVTRIPWLAKAQRCRQRKAQMCWMHTPRAERIVLINALQILGVTLSHGELEAGNAT